MVSICRTSLPRCLTSQDVSHRLKTSLNVPNGLEVADVPNERLREAFLSAGLSYDDVAESMGVDPKTVERWVTKGREPFRKHRNRVATMVGESEGYLWPDAYTEREKGSASDSEVIKLYARRGLVPADLWLRLFDRAEQEIDILVIAGLFLPEQAPDLPDQLASKAEGGSRVRLAMADPSSTAVEVRADEEGIGAALRGRVENASAYFRSPEHDAIERRLHGTTLYNSIFRFDDEMLVSTHVYGLAGAHAPVLHLKRIAGGEMFETYARAFERVWEAAVPAVGVQAGV